MCGIYGHIKKSSKTNSLNACIDGLKKLEYRGYDSAGVAGIHDGKIVCCKTVGKVVVLERAVKAIKLELSVAIAHTRWATHGKITETNAHPHFDESRSIALVHNGIIENYQKLKTELEENGIEFLSETDTEVISQLISFHYENDISKAIQKTLPLLEGSFAIAFIHKDHPDKIIASSRGCPLAIGICHESHDIFLSSDSNAFTSSKLDVFYLHDDEYAIISHELIEVYNLAGIKLVKQIETLNLENISISKEGFDHFLLKEIHDQPLSISKAIENRLDYANATANFSELTLSDEELQKTNRILILACGSSYHAGCIAKQIFEAYAKIPTEVEIASEFRYKDPIILKNTLILAISQSGETADTLAAVKESKRSNCPVIALCNVKRSSLSRLASSTLWLNAGPEISVCSTKAFTSQLTLLMLLALKIARLKTLSHKEGKKFLFEIERLPAQIADILSKSSEIEKIAKKYAGHKDFFFIGRNYMYPTSLEAALKLKEITYLNATGYPAGEMKHGPIALISKKLVTIALCGNKHTFEKLLSNLMEIKSRGGPIVAFAPKNSSEILSLTNDVIFLSDSISDTFAPITYSICCQLLAYYIAKFLGKDIDQPRNLAKSVTVE
ncbi:MAG: glutamine--fructose-6-phosphate transaminase (isomerizing) [Chlamydiae bacterium]|nr:glutamine--fructose-6-phosphate transaminase (isomerizing) [Chlamydiota bacterium]